MSAGRLLLIPWHIGNVLDTTVHAAMEVRRLRTLLVEDLRDVRFQLRRTLDEDADAKTLLLLPERPDPSFLDGVLAALEREDVGLLSSGGAPAFVDPGSWVVAEVRRRGIEVQALAGASCLSTMLALSGLEWRQGGANAFSFTLFIDGPPGGTEERDFDAAARRREAVFVLLQAAQVPRCLERLRPLVGERPVTLFFDLTKPREQFPLADAVRTLRCEEWLDAARGLPWDRISDVALMVGP